MVTPEAQSSATSSSIGRVEWPIARIRARPQPGAALVCADLGGTGRLSVAAAARAPLGFGVDKRGGKAQSYAPMLAAKPPAGPKRWPRGQKFAITPVGEAAQAEYRDAVTGARTSGRSALESALAAWAAPLGLRPGDGTVLSELRGDRRGVPDLCERLETAGIAPDEVRSALHRLVEAGLVGAIPPASQVGVPS
jgi:hypothetical protein